MVPSEMKNFVLSYGICVAYIVFHFQETYGEMWTLNLHLEAAPLRAPSSTPLTD